MQVYEVSPTVNRVTNDAPALHEPYSADAAVVGEPPSEKPRPGRKTRPALDTGQGSLF
jgi:hypothetical protein